MEQLCVRSFLDQGHPFHLFAYQDIENVPAGTKVHRGAEILPAEEIFCYRRGAGKGSPSAFANCFRYRLLLERGGWWTDMDMVCVKPLDMADDHVLGNEREPDGSRHINVALFKAPPGSPVAEYCWNQCQTVDRAKLRWGQIGPRLGAQAVQSVNVPVRVLPPEAFYPIDHWQVHRFVRERDIPEDCYAIHLWHAKWRQAGLDPDAIFDPQCIYEQLKRKHGVASPPGAARGDAGGSDAGPHSVWNRLRSLWRSPDGCRAA